MVRTKDDLLNEIEELKKQVSELKEDKIRQGEIPKGISYRVNQLKESKERIREFADLSPAGIYMADKHGDFIYVNDAWKKMTGMTSEEASGKGWLEALHPDNIDQIHDQWYRMLENKKEWITDYKFISKDNEIIWVHGCAKPFYNDRDDLLGYIGLTVDISQHKQAEIELKLSKNRYRTYIDNATTAIFITDSQGNYIDVNPAACQMTGYSKEELLNSSILDITSPQQKEAERHIIESLKAKGSMQSESLVRRKDGTDFPVELSLVAIQGNRYMSFCTDITDRKRVEEDLEKSEEKYRDLSNLLPQIIFEIDLDGILTYVNQRAFDVFGYSKNDFAKGINVLSTLIPEDRDRAQKNIQKILFGGQPGDPEYTAIKKGGNTFPILIYANTICENGSPSGLRGVIVDISHRKKAENALKKSEEKYRQLYKNALVGLFSVSFEEGIPTVANKAAAQLFGYSSIKQFREQFRSVNHYADPNEREKVILQIREKGFIDRILLHSKKLDGTLIWNEASFRMSDDKLSINCVFIDVTERVEASKALKESEERFDLAVNATKDGIYDWNLLNNKIYFSPATKHMLGYEDWEVSNDPKVWEKMADPNDLERSWKMQKELIEKKRDRFELEVRMKHKNGHWVDIFSRAKAIFDDSGKAVRIVGTRVDITELRQAERRAVKERDTRQQYLDIANIMLLSLDANGVVKLINPKGCEILGYKENEIVGQIWYDTFLPERLREKVKKVATKVYSGEIESARYYENVIVNKSGEERRIAWNNAVFKNENGQITGTLSSGEDITDRKLAEEELKRHHDHLEEMVSERTVELEIKNKELDDMLKAFVGRELKINRLEEEVRRLKSKV